MATPKKEGRELVVKSNTFIGTVYSQVVSVTITDVDLTLEFVYVNPRPNREGVSQGEVVSRVTLPIEAAKGLSDTIIDTLKKHFDKKGD